MHSGKNAFKQTTFSIIIIIIYYNVYVYIGRHIITMLNALG